MEGLKMFVYLAACVANKVENGQIQNFTVANINVAHSEAEAEGLALATLREAAPPTEGWRNHSACVGLLEREFLEKLLEVTQQSP